MKTKNLALFAALGAAFAFFSAKAQAHAPDTLIEDDANMNDFDKRVQAFLHMIRTLETQSTEPYGVFYGGARFHGFDDHPVITGEMRGVPLSQEMCRNAGYASGICVSTAAGAYQFNVPTWNEVRAETPRLPDFSPQSQDEAAIRLLRKIGALDSLAVGDFDTALQQASRRWASLPFSTAKQNPKSYAYALSQYLSYLEA